MQGDVITFPMQLSTKDYGEISAVVSVSREDFIRMLRDSVGLTESEEGVAWEIGKRQLRDRMSDEVMIAALRGLWRAAKETAEIIIQHRLAGAVEDTEGVPTLAGFKTLPAFEEDLKTLTDGWMKSRLPRKRSRAIDPVVALKIVEEMKGLLVAEGVPKHAQKAHAALREAFGMTEQGFDKLLKEARRLKSRSR